MAALTNKFITKGIAHFVLTAFSLVAANDVFAADGNVLLPGECFTNDANGTAVTKLQTALKARGQKMVLTADQAIPLIKNGQRVVDANGEPVTIYKENYFTSSTDWKEGYNIISDAPAGQVSDRYCVGDIYTNVRVYNAYTSKDVPAEVNKGELGVALRGGNSIHRNVAMTATSITGESVYAVVVNTQDSNAYGSKYLASADGSGAGGLGDFKQVVYAKNIAAALGIRYATQQSE